MFPTRSEMLVNHEQCLTTPSMSNRLGLLLLADVKLSCKVAITNVFEG